MELKIVTRGNSKFQERKNDAECSRSNKRGRDCNRSKFVAHSSERSSDRKRHKVSHQPSGKKREKLTLAEAYCLQTESNVA